MKQPVLYGGGGSYSDWFQTIAVTAPNGSSITVSGGGETLTAIGTGTYYAFAVHNKSTQYTITVSIDGVSAPSQTVTTGTTSGVISFVEVKFGTINVTLSNNFVGETVTCTQGGTTISKVASTTSLTFRVPSTGTWTIASTVSGQPYSVSATVTDLDVAESVNLVTNITLSVTLHSATEDTVTFTDVTGAKVEVFASGQSSKTVNITIPSSGMNITFTSSVALDPDNLDGSHYYSKQVTVDNNTTDIFVMPDNTLYWYGYNKDIEAGSSANGWGIASGYSFTAPTFNTQNIQLSSAQNYQCWIGEKNPSNFDAYNFIIQGTNEITENRVGVARLMSSKNPPTTEISETLYNTILYRSVLNNTNKTNVYPAIQASNGQGVKCYGIYGVNT